MALAIQSNGKLKVNKTHADTAFHSATDPINKQPRIRMAGLVGISFPISALRQVDEPIPFPRFRPQWAGQ
jgi:hypothetical protein